MSYVNVKTPVHKKGWVITFLLLHGGTYLCNDNVALWIRVASLTSWWSLLCLRSVREHVCHREGLMLARHFNSAKWQGWLTQGRLEMELAKLQMSGPQSVSDLLQFQLWVMSINVDFMTSFWRHLKQRENKRLAVLAPGLPTAPLTTSLSAYCGISKPWIWQQCAVLPWCFASASLMEDKLAWSLRCVGTVLYEDMDHTIQRAIQMPVCQQEDGSLLHQKIALQLRRPNQLPLTQ